MKKTLDVTAPSDPYRMVYAIFYWLGIGTLLPWNFFISLSEYWKTKWSNVTEVAVGQEDFEGKDFFQFFNKG